MPELPEVETVLRGLSSGLVGRQILHAEIFKPLVVKTPARIFLSALQGRTVRAVTRHGKSIFWTLDSGAHVKVHLGMSGALLFHSKSNAIDKYVRVRFVLDDPDNDLVFRDVRQFGRVALATEPFEKKWGPDAWTASPDRVFAALRKKKGMIKHALMNQNVVAGLGNIYVDETLFSAKIHPKRKLERLSDATLRALCDASRAVLERSIEAGGTSFRDYMNTAGRRGSFLERLNVYGKTSKPCVVCGTPIKKIIVASRGTHFCPRCQKK